MSKNYLRTPLLLSVVEKCMNDAIAERIDGQLRDPEEVFSS